MGFSNAAANDKVANQVNAENRNIYIPAEQGDAKLRAAIMGADPAARALLLSGQRGSGAAAIGGIPQRLAAEQAANMQESNLLAPQRQAYEQQIANQAVGGALSPAMQATLNNGFAQQVAMARGGHSGNTALTGQNTAALVNPYMTNQVLQGANQQGNQFAQMLAQKQQYQAGLLGSANNLQRGANEMNLQRQKMDDQQRGAMFSGLGAGLTAYMAYPGQQQAAAPSFGVASPTSGESAGFQPIQTDSTPMSGSGPVTAARGGLIKRYAAGGAVKGYDDGGTVYAQGIPGLQSSTNQPSAPAAGNYNQTQYGQAQSSAANWIPLYGQIDPTNQGFITGNDAAFYNQAELDALAQQRQQYGQQLGAQAMGQGLSGPLQAGLNAQNNQATALAKSVHSTDPGLAARQLQAGQASRAQTMINPAQAAAQQQFGAFNAQQQSYGADLNQQLLASRQEAQRAQQAKDAYNQQQSGNMLGQIGAVGGAIVGGIYGGPAGAVVGSQAGGAIGGAAGKRMYGGGEASNPNGPRSRVGQFFSGMNLQGGGAVPRIPGMEAVKPGDHAANDKVPAILSEGEAVLPRSVMNSKNPGEAAKRFVEAIKSKQRKA